MNKVILTGFIEVPVNELETVKAELAEHIKLTKREPGCVTFSAAQRKDCPSIFDVYEEFVNIEAFENHQNRIASSKWALVTKKVKRHYTIVGHTGR